MEKVVYVVWKPEGQSPEDFKRRLLGEVAPALQALQEPAVTGIRVSVSDDDVAAGTPISSMQPGKDGIVSFWLEQSQDAAVAEALIAPACAKLAGYLVVESRPLITPADMQTPPGERTPGANLVTCICKRADLSHADFVSIWYGQHRACAIETQSTFGYTRNEIHRAITPDAPQWTAIVEENFPIQAITSEYAFYDAAEGDDAKLEANRTRMMDTCAKFLDLTKIESHPCSEYDFS